MTVNSIPKLMSITNWPSFLYKMIMCTHVWRHIDISIKILKITILDTYIENSSHQGLIWKRLLKNTCPKEDLIIVLLQQLPIHVSMDTTFQCYMSLYTNSQKSLKLQNLKPRTTFSFASLTSRINLLNYWVPFFLRIKVILVYSNVLITLKVAFTVTPKNVIFLHTCALMINLTPSTLESLGSHYNKAIPIWSYVASLVLKTITVFVFSYYWAVWWLPAQRKTNRPHYGKPFTNFFYGIIFHPTFIKSTEVADWAAMFSCKRNNHGYHVNFIISWNFKKMSRSGPRNTRSNRYGLM